MIDPQAAVDFMIAKSGEYAKAKADRIYCDEYRKTLKAQLMKDAMVGKHETAVAQEREAYAHPDYKQHLLAIKEAVEAEEKLRWLLIAAEARIEVYRTQSANNRALDRVTL
jgi:hypothetical protein